ncbi:MAG: molecular chaperone DnaJ [Candidatus Latescibacteria bacterium]|nr:molecular chaperone DnaJ [Candidatus Latescibacterota bacterium]
MAKRDYYEVLGLDKGADDQAIKSAYRKLALKYHPDRNPDDESAEELFKEASEAYEILSDADKRAQYDRFGHAAVEQNFGGGGFQWSDFSHAGEFEDIFGDVLNSFFGGGRRRGASGPPRGRDLKIPLDLTLEEIAQGVEKKINLSRLQACETCDGTGAASGSQPQSCDTCRGAGQVQQVSRSLFGQSVRVVACPACEGVGQIVSDPCQDCDGDGRRRGKTTLSVKIPAGVSEGNYIQLRGEGEVGPRGGPSGDCLVYIREQEHEHFVRDGNDVLYRLPIGFSKATLGGEVEVPTLSGRTKMKVPAGTQSGRVFRMARRGVPDVNGNGVGDQLVEVALWTPTDLGEEERRLFGELQRLEEERAASEGKSFFDRMREAFSG